MSSRRADIRALRAHRVPDWWRDAKLGIFVHWTPASVPGFAPTTDEIGELLATGDPRALAHSPYSEWYENSMRFPDSPVARHHAEVYGDRPYRDFGQVWEARVGALGSRRMGGVLRSHGRALCRARDQASRRVLPVAERDRQSPPARLELVA